MPLQGSVSLHPIRTRTWTDMLACCDRCPRLPHSLDRCPLRSLRNRRCHPAVWMPRYTMTSCAQYGLVERHAATVIFAAEHDQPGRVLPTVAPGCRILLCASRCAESCPASRDADGRSAVQRVEAARLAGGITQMLRQNAAVGEDCGAMERRDTGFAATRGTGRRVNGTHDRSLSTRAV